MMGFGAIKMIDIPKVHRRASTILPRFQTID